VFGLTLQFTGSYRLAVLPLVISFLAGLAILSRVDVRLAARDAGNSSPEELQ
jgi:UMF1 family MFS transporter